MADPRRYELDELSIRPGTYFNPQTEVVLIVDDSPDVDHEIFDDVEPGEGADWVLISDEAPVDEHRRDELIESFQAHLPPRRASWSSPAKWTTRTTSRTRNWSRTRRSTSSIRAQLPRVERCFGAAMGPAERRRIVRRMRAVRVPAPGGVALCLLVLGCATAAPALAGRSSWRRARAVAPRRRAASRARFLTTLARLLHSGAIAEPAYRQYVSPTLPRQRSLGS